MHLNILLSRLCTNIWQYGNSFKKNFSCKEKYLRPNNHMIYIRIYCEKNLVVSFFFCTFAASYYH